MEDPARHAAQPIDLSFSLDKEAHLPEDVTEAMRFDIGDSSHQSVVSR